MSLPSSTETETRYRFAGRHAAAGVLRVPIPTLLSMAVLVLVCAVAVLAPMIAPADPLRQHLSDALVMPGGRTSAGISLLGTDNLGRDELSRLIYGARPLAMVVAASMAISGLLGLVLGIVAAVVGGVVETVILRIADFKLAIPSLLFALLLAFVLGAGPVSEIVAIALVTWPPLAKVVRADAWSVMSSEYVAAARVAGLSPARVMRRHVLPNVLSGFTVLFTFSIAAAVLVDAALSFMGLGVQPPQAAWGSMLASGTTYLQSWWLALWPGLCVSAVMISVNMLGDYMRDVLDPRTSALRGTADLDHAGAVEPPAPAMHKADDRETARREALLSIDRLTIEAGSRPPIVNQVSFDIGWGEVIALIGESGSGKSTIGRAVVGLLPDQMKVVGGYVTVNGSDMVRATARELRALRGRAVGIVFQDPLSSLDPVRRIHTQLREARRIHRLGTRKETDSWVLSTLGALGFNNPHRAARGFPVEFSGGMRQRVAVGIAYSADASLIVADEPTTALDASLQGRILRLILDFRARRSTSLLLISHDVRIVRAVADRVVVLYRGRVMEQGPADVVLKRPGSPYTKLLLDAEPRLVRNDADEDAEPVWAASDAPTTEAGCPFVARCPRAVDRCEQEFPAAAEDTEGVAIWCWNPLR